MSIKLRRVPENAGNFWFGHSSFHKRHLRETKQIHSSQYLNFRCDLEFPHEVIDTPLGVENTRERLMIASYAPRRIQTMSFSSHWTYGRYHLVRFIHSFPTTVIRTSLPNVFLSLPDFIHFIYVPFPILLCFYFVNEFRSHPIIEYSSKLPPSFSNIPHPTPSVLQFYEMTFYNLFEALSLLLTEVFLRRFSPKWTYGRHISV